jgi:hypothetical protein
VSHGILHVGDGRYRDEFQAVAAVGPAQYSMSPRLEVLKWTIRSTHDICWRALYTP